MTTRVTVTNHGPSKVKVQAVFAGSGEPNGDAQVLDAGFGSDHYVHSNQILSVREIGADEGQQETGTGEDAGKETASASPAGSEVNNDDAPVDGEGSDQG